MKKKETKSTENIDTKEQHVHVNEQQQNKAANQKGSKDTAAEKSKEDAAGKESILKEEIDTLQKQLDEANDKFLRLFSEFDNYRKRIAKERVELTKTASESVITAMLPILDDLERAYTMDSGEAENESKTRKEGISLILNKFKSILRQKGVEEIPAVGEDFNTDFHDAITHIPAKNKAQKGKVVEEAKKGYMLNGKVIRYASVIVAN